MGSNGGAVEDLGLSKSFLSFSGTLGPTDAETWGWVQNTKNKIQSAYRGTKTCSFNLWKTVS